MDPRCRFASLQTPYCADVRDRGLESPRLFMFTSSRRPSSRQSALGYRLLLYRKTHDIERRTKQKKTIRNKGLAACCSKPSVGVYLLPHYPENLSKRPQWSIRDGLLLLGMLGKPVHDVQQGISGHHVGVRFGASLRIHGARYVGKLAQDVESVNHHQQLALAERTRKAGVPHQVGRVELRVGIARATVKREVGGEVELPRQMHRSVRTYAVLPGGNVLERGAGAGIAVPRHVRGEVQRMLAQGEAQLRRH